MLDTLCMNWPTDNNLHIFYTSYKNTTYTSITQREHTQKRSLTHMHTYNMYSVIVSLAPHTRTCKDRPVYTLSMHVPECMCVKVCDWDSICVGEVAELCL